MTVVSTETLRRTVGALREGVDRERLATDDSFASGAWRRGEASAGRPRSPLSLRGGEIVDAG